MRMGELSDAQQAVEAARRGLIEAVAAARAQGRTWADIGEELGMSRQAAFKRFGEPVDPRRGDTIGTRGVQDIRELTEGVFALMAGGDYDGLAKLMHPVTAQELPTELIADTWRAVLAEVGTLERFLDTRIELPGGTPIADGEQVIGSVIGATVLDCGAGQVRGRVAFDDQSKIVGLLLVPMEHGPLPF